MITNIDDNRAKLTAMLKREGLADNTILVFMTDNGTAGGVKGNRGYDGNMRGKKNSEYEGGHRVPFIIRWPGGKIEAGKMAPSTSRVALGLSKYINSMEAKRMNIYAPGLPRKHYA